MAVSSRGRNAEVLVSRKWKDREITPERTRVWAEPSSNKLNNGSVERKVPVVYYICRNGQLEHPHFMEVPLSSKDGLYLKDVINRLNLLRGKGMASLYSWSSKRSYKNGFVWHDLAESDLIFPTHGHEYVLKGSEILDLDPCLNPNKSLLESTPSSRSLRPPPIQKSPSPGNESDSPKAVSRRRNQSWSSIDLNEYKVYKTEPFSESTRRLAADAATQTDDKRRRRRQVKQEEEIEEVQEEKSRDRDASREEIEISPPPSDSSPETLESLLKADGRLLLSGNEESSNPTVGNCTRMKASAVLMQLISCGSISFRDCGATAVKEQGLSSSIGQCKGRQQRGGDGGTHVGTSREIPNLERVRLEEKEYFSGSLIETKKEEVPALKRSNSCNADRSSQLQLAEKEIEGVRTKCLPRKSKAMSSSKKVNNINVNCDKDDDTKRSQQGSKRFDAHFVENDSRKEGEALAL